MFHLLFDFERNERIAFNTSFQFESGSSIDLNLLTF